MYEESDLLMISALQHLIFCPRQCALIHIEQVWAENRFTMEGQILHEHVHNGTTENRKHFRTECGMQIRSLELGITGITDIVEFEYETSKRKKIIDIIPVEYKRGKAKKNNSDNVQLCAQAICLEEMLGVPVERGQIYYGKQRKRHDVNFDSELRTMVTETAATLHELYDSGKTPAPEYCKKCDTCSLFDLCLPDKVGKNVKKYLDNQIKISGEETQ